MVKLVQVVFRNGTVTEEILWDTMVLLPKWKGGYRGIGLVEVLWNMCSVVVNCQLKISVVFRDALHGFIKGKGAGTATLEAKLAHKMAGLVHDPLFRVFLDVCKACASLGRERSLELLRIYGMETNLSRLLDNHWKWQRIFPKIGNCMGGAFGTGRRVTQGDPASPIISNIVVDAVVWVVLEELCSPQEA